MGLGCKELLGIQQINNNNKNGDSGTTRKRGVDGCNIQETEMHILSQILFMVV